MLVTAMGHVAEAVYEGAVAIDRVMQCRPEVLILDLGMPGLDGYEVCRRVRASAAGASLYIIAMTGWGQPEDRARTRQAGFDAHLVKPVDAHALEHMLRQAVSGVAKSATARA